MGISLFRLFGAICRDETIASTGGVRASLIHLHPKVPGNWVPAQVHEHLVSLLHDAVSALGRVSAQPAA